VCECGATYAEFRTHLTFAQVQRMMFVGPDPETWRRKHRRAVLGFWNEIKRSMWWSEHGACEELAPRRNAA